MSYEPLLCHQRQISRWLHQKNTTMTVASKLHGLDKMAVEDVFGGPEQKHSHVKWLYGCLGLPPMLPGTKLTARRH